MELKNKVALVTGSGRNMGKAIALGLAKAGADLIINYSSSKKGAEETRTEAKKMGVRAVTIKADVSKSNQVLKMVEKAEDEFGGIDILVNNSGVIKRATIDELDEETWDNIQDVNLKGVFLCSKIVSERMKKRKNGKIINISSLGGIKAWPSYMAYCASKAGVIMLTKCLALSLAPHIQVNSIAPGTISFPDDVNEEAKEGFLKKIPLKRFGDYGDIVKTVVFLCKDSSYITGQTIVVDGGLMLK
ncbi:MAG: hypothetical protein A3C43_05030 [Candidatus Schekmanbacteria bacterium RIFCSPHIGHO2_02_FULL_38_11]|nr:MAG: hypothetical protein A3C43_05030 [Candidatus Schekmanbacteria bacterium RIFCSPHIGHO2_02_FULL_38_11]